MDVLEAFFTSCVILLQVKMCGNKSANRIIPPMKNKTVSLKQKIKILKMKGDLPSPCIPVAWPVLLAHVLVRGTEKKLLNIKVFS